MKFGRIQAANNHNLFVCLETHFFIALSIAPCTETRLSPGEAATVGAITVGAGAAAGAGAATGAGTAAGAGTLGGGCEGNAECFSLDPTGTATAGDPR